MPEDLSVEKIVDEIFHMYENLGNENYVGEPVTLVEHMTQAAMLAEKDGATEEVILSALFHDIGHLLGLRDGNDKMVTGNVNIGTQRHESLGADYLKKCGFPSKITDPVLHHVNVKRYKVCRNPEYYNKLSDVSKKTLVHQGGPMSEEEAQAFEAMEHCEDILRVRVWDEQAKVPNFKIDSLDKYRQMTTNYLKKLRSQ